MNNAKQPSANPAHNRRRLSKRDLADLLEVRKTTEIRSHLPDILEVLDVTLIEYQNIKIFTVMQSKILLDKYEELK